MKRFIAISLLGVAYLVAAPLMAITVFEDGGKAMQIAVTSDTKKGTKRVTESAVPR